MSEWLHRDLFAITPADLLLRSALLILAVFGLLFALRRVRRHYREQNERIAAQLKREKVFSQLGHALNSATVPIDAARIIVHAAQELIGWHASLLKLYDPETGEGESVVSFDTIDGNIQEVGPPLPLASPMTLKVVKEGAQLILRESDPAAEQLINYGNQRKSASLMFVPIRKGEKPIGVLSIQSYDANAFDKDDLAVLQNLADHSGGAFDRINSQRLLRKAYEEMEEKVKERTRELLEANTRLHEEVLDHQKTESLLSKEQHLLQSFIENVPDSIYFKDIEGRFIRVNREKLQRFGLTDPSQILGKTDFDFFAEDDARGMRADEVCVMQTGQPIITKEEELRRRDGTVCWMLTTKMALRSEAGEIIGTFGVTRDITPQKKAEQALVFSQHLLETIMNSVPDYIYFKDAQGRFTRVNNAFAGQFGRCEPQEMIGKTDFDFLSREAAEESFSDEQQIISSGKAIYAKEEHEFWLDGREWWVLTSKMPFRDERGTIIGTFGITRDITARKLAEEALQQAQRDLEKRVSQRTAELSEANARLRGEIEERNAAQSRSSTFSNLGVQLSQARTRDEAARIVLNAADEISGWDAAYIHLYSSDYKRVIPICCADIINGQRVISRDYIGDDELSARDRKIINGGAELLLRSEEGQRTAEDSGFGNKARRSLSLMYVPVRNGDKVIGALSIQSYSPNAYTNEDLNTLQALADFCAGTLERIEAERALRESEERFSKAFRGSPIPLTLSTLREGRYIDVNDGMIRLMGHSREEMIGKTSLELNIWRSAADRAAMVGRLEKNRFVRDLECELQTKTGQIRNVLLSVELMDFKGEQTILVSFYDITDRLNLEEQLRHSQKMEAIGQLAAGVAHDFNNILTIMQGHASLLLSSPGLSSEMTASLTEVSLGVDRAANLTRQLLTFSRKQVMQPRALDLNEVIGHTSNMLQRLLGENISLHFNYSPQLPQIHGDSGMIEQVLINLAVNARDAMERGGRLIISTVAQRIDSAYVEKNRDAREGSFVCLSVTDTGCGMDASTLSRIFEPFFTTKEVGKGTGLGLATVYGIVKQHQGWLEVNSEPGKGSTFKIYLPTNGRRQETLSTPEQPPVVKKGQETIMVVEDEPALRELVKTVLEHYGYRIIEAMHGKEALSIWPKHRNEVDLVLTDMVMPEGVSGVELAEQLKKDMPGLKIIYTSGYSMDLFNKKQKLIEGINFLPKPYQPRTLAKLVRDCLDA